MQKWMESHIVSLSDRTKVGGYSWNKIKKQVMEENFREQDWFKKLNAEERKLIKALRKAQKEQGNMDRLTPQPYDAEHS